MNGNSILQLLWMAILLTVPALGAESTQPLKDTFDGPGWRFYTEAPIRYEPVVDRDRTYVAAVHLAEGRLVQLADEAMRTVDLTRDGRWGIGRDGSKYVSDWKPAYADYYRVDTRTGEYVGRAKD